jgi:hypothetical protein
MPLLSGRRKGDAFAAATLVPAPSDIAAQSIPEPINA